jgi:hypothetical protein
VDPVDPDQQHWFFRMSNISKFGNPGRRELKVFKFEIKWKNLRIEKCQYSSEGNLPNGDQKIYLGLSCETLFYYFFSLEKYLDQNPVPQIKIVI